MSIRAIVLGLALGLFVAGATYFNDAVIRQTMFIGHHMPPIVFGLMGLLLLVVHPLWRMVGGAGLRGGEVAVVVALALAACGWPGNSFYRGFASVAALPAHWLKIQPGWLAADVLSFVPGASGNLAPEQIRDWPGFVAALGAAADAEQPGPAGRLVARLDREAQRQLAALSYTPGDLNARQRVTVAVNRVLADATWYDAEAFAAVDLPSGLHEALTAARAGALPTFDRVRANRALLVAAMPEQVMPIPRGSGMLLLDGRVDTPVHDQLMYGRPGPRWLGVREVPWGAWWPTFRLWGGLAAALGLASLCLALIVHPQWSQRELLPYPIARVVHEIARIEPGQRLPAIAQHRGFWIALGAVLVLHLINGLQVWIESLPHLPLRLDFTGLRELFPHASRVFGNEAYFHPRIYPAVIAFALFLPASVSFSLGIAQMLLMVLGGFLLMWGIPMERDYMGGSKVNMLAFGAFLAMLAMMLYVGRRYYLNVAATMVGLPREAGTPGYVRWAGWGLVGSTVAAVLVLHSGGVSWPVGAVFVGLILLLWLVMARISAETGLILIKPAWVPAGVITALVGFEAIGPTAYVAVALATVMIVGESREAMMPYLTNGLRVAEGAGRGVPARIGPWLAAMVVASLLVAGGVSLYLQHNVGLNLHDGYVARSMSIWPLDRLAGQISEARAHHTMVEAVTAQGWQRWSLVRPNGAAVGWVALGFGLVLVTAAARLRLSWWPLHPMVFLVWGTYPMFVFSFSLLLGWLVKLGLVGTGGARAYHRALPVAVGVILGEVLAVLGWSAVGAAYYFATGLTPRTYWIFPG